MRVTGVRLAVLGVLEGTERALTAQDVADAVASLRPRSRPDRVTVYRTLNALVEAGLAHKVDPGDRVFRFSLTDHARCSGEHHAHEHPHFVCDSCGEVECLEGAEVVIKPAPPAAPAPSPAPAPAPAPRRRVKQQDVLLHGTCERCVDEPRRKTG
jgi:Fur family ferric uptake transcriptional regulator